MIQISVDKEIRIKTMDLKNTFNYISYCLIYCSVQGGFWQGKTDDGKSKWHNVYIVDVDAIKDQIQGYLPGRLNFRCDGKHHMFEKKIKEREYGFVAKRLCPAYMKYKELRAKITEEGK